MQLHKGKPKINKALAHEEQMREIALSHHGDESRAYGWSGYKIKIGPKKLIITNGYGKEFILEKSPRLGESLDIVVSYLIKKTERCSLGHDHVKSEERTWESVSIRWEYVDQLIEWLQLGSWSEVKNGEPSHFKTLRECKEFLDVVAKSDNALKGSAKSLINKINEQMRGYRSTGQLDDK